MFWLRVPQKVYFKKGCLPVALDELGAVYHKKKALIVTDSFLYQNGCIKPVEEKLNSLGIQHTSFFNIQAEPVLSSAKEGAKTAVLFEPDVIIAVGGGSVIDTAKIIRVLYEYPEADFADLASRFNDIRKRDELFPKAGVKAHLVAIPTSSGTGSEVSPFAVITDKDVTYTVADYQLLPDIAVIDADFMMAQPKELTVSAGFTALVHAVQAYVSDSASDYTDGFAIKALQSIFAYLPSAYEKGADDPVAREKLSEASTMAGIAFANAYDKTSGISYGVKGAKELTSSVSGKRYTELAKALGIQSNNDAEAAELLAAKINELLKICGAE